VGKFAGQLLVSHHKGAQRVARVPGASAVKTTSQI
jgi:hypothetical protein